MRTIIAALTLGTALTLSMAAQAKTLVYCSEGSPENFNPQINTTGTSFDASQEVYSRLIEFERGGTALIPGLAEKWQVSDDGTVITFTLRKGVKFHSNANFKPSRDFTADDVLFSFNRMWKEDHPYHKVSGGAYDYFKDMSMPDLLKSIEKIDDHTVKFTLNAPEAPFLANLAMPFAAILSAEYGEAMLKANTPEKIDQDPIGTGPFALQQYQKDAQIRYKAHKAYFGGKPTLDNVVFSITPDAAVRKAKLEAGECHVMAYPAPADLPALEKNKDVKLLSQEGLNVGYLAFNVTKPPFDKKEVRQAINMAVNKKAILEAVYQGAGAAAKNPIPPVMAAYNTEIKEYPYDPEKAKELLAKAGVTNLSTDLWAMPVQRPYNPNAKRIAEIMQADLAKVGITAEIKSFEWGEYRKRAQQGEHQMAQLGWIGDNGDPDNFLYVLLGCEAARAGGSNISKWCNADFDKLLKDAKKVSDPAKRNALYKQAQEIFHEEAPWLPIAYSVVFEPVRKNVQDYRINPFGLHVFNGVKLK
jgi:dipeptide transport system substrate-binding protein